MFDDDSELRRILKLTPGSVSETFGFRWELGVRSSVFERRPFVQTIVWGHGGHRWTRIAKI